MQLSQKELLVEKYQHLLQAAREELSAATEAHKSEVSSLMRQLHSQTDSALSRLREVELEAINIPQPVLPTDDQLDRLRELEELTVETRESHSDTERRGCTGETTIETSSTGFNEIIE